MILQIKKKGEKNGMTWCGSQEIVTFSFAANQTDWLIWYNIIIIIRLTHIRVSVSICNKFAV